MSNNSWMIYGAYGYTGELTAREAVSRGLRPILAGRNESRTKALADELGLDYRAFDLDVAAEHLGDVDLVLHCAGPFSQTAVPMMDACLQTKTHYLDITGEIDVFRAGHQRDAQAKAAGVVIMPGVGFDVVPTDCLAASLQAQMPDANDLVLAFAPGGGPSVGTAKTSFEALGEGGKIRRDGEMVSVPLAYATREFDFAGQGERRFAISIPWGDVFTAFISTGIPNIMVYMSAPPSSAKKLKKLERWRWLLRWPIVKSLGKKLVGRQIRNPSGSRREQTETWVVGEVKNPAGEVLRGRTLTPNGYTFTVIGSLGAVEQLQDLPTAAGYHTPSSLFGAGFAASLPGVTQEIGVAAI